MLALVSSSLLLGACSNGGNSSRSTLINVKVQAGQEDLDASLIRNVLITEGGELNQDQTGAEIAASVTTDNQGQAVVSIDGTELIYFDVYGREANSELGVKQSTRRCQWVDGCGGVAFGNDVAIAASPGWSSVAFGLSSDELIRITPLTDLAAKLAFNLVYSENDAQPGWMMTNYYSVFSVVQSVSQISKMFGINNVQSSEPADLTQMSELANLDSSEAQQRLRYGALLAAWQYYEMQYTGTVDLPFFADAVGVDLVTNEGQLFQAGGSQTLNLADFYRLAATNLAAVSVTNATVERYRNAAVSVLNEDANAFVDGELTNITPASLYSLLGSELNTYQLGINRTKAFVDVLRDIGTTFFEPGYRSELDKQAETLQTLGDKHADNLETIAQANRQTFEFYRSCYLSAGCPTPDPAWTWLENFNYNSNTARLTLNNGSIVVTQEPADVNALDGITVQTSSRAIDVIIEGQYKVNDLTFKLQSQRANDVITSTSGVRVFYPSSYAVLQDPASVDEIGYELRWPIFSLYDLTTDGTDLERELTGAFSMSYTAVDDPNGVGERRYNIDNVVLNSRITDEINDSGSNDRNIVTLFVSAASSNATEFYPDREFASFNGFFRNGSSSALTKGFTTNDLVSYRQGSETIFGRNIQFLDYYVVGGESIRYRFYPTVKREDIGDVDNDGNLTELVDTHDLEQCVLSSSDVNATVTSCEPKQRVFTPRNVQATVNNLWELGVFSRLEVPGEGVYFVKFPTNAADANGCLALAPLATAKTPLPAELYQEAELGFDRARFTSEVVLDFTSESDPKTLLDVQLSAPSAEQVDVRLALSHDYLTVDSNSNPLLAQGPNLDRLILNYSTINQNMEMGSVAVFKDGVALKLLDGSTDTLDSELLASGKLNLLTGMPLYKYRVDESGSLA
ncbi:MAG: hypothetical protein P1U57_02835, partial [Oleibacter sp.]|nr:hypothetical protein [Thalassolituus sp.]